MAALSSGGASMDGLAGGSSTPFARSAHRKTTTVKSILDTDGALLHPLAEENEEDVLREMEDQESKSPKKKKRTSSILKNVVKNMMRPNTPDGSATDNATVQSEEPMEESSPQISPRKQRKSITARLGVAGSSNVKNSRETSSQDHEVVEDILHDPSEKVELLDVPKSPVKTLRRFISLPARKKGSSPVQPSKRKTQEERKQARHDILSRVGNAIGDPKTDIGDSEDFLMDNVDKSGEIKLVADLESSKQDKSGKNRFSRIRKKAMNLFQAKSKDDEAPKGMVILDDPSSELMASSTELISPIAKLGDTVRVGPALPRPSLESVDESTPTDTRTDTEPKTSESTPASPSVFIRSKGSEETGSSSAGSGTQLAKRRHRSTSPTRNANRNTAEPETPRRARLSRRHSKSHMQEELNASQLSSSEGFLSPRERMQRSSGPKQALDIEDSTRRSRSAEPSERRERSAERNDQAPGEKISTRRRLRRTNSKSSEVEGDVKLETSTEAETSTNRRRVRRTRSSGEKDNHQLAPKSPTRRRIRRANSKSRGPDEGESENLDHTTENPIDLLSPKTPTRRRVRRADSKSSPTDSPKTPPKEDPLKVRRRIKRSKGNGKANDEKTSAEEHRRTRRSKSPQKHAKTLSRSESPTKRRKQTADSSEDRELRRRRHRSGSPQRNHQSSLPTKDLSDSERKHRRRHGSPSRKSNATSRSKTSSSRRGPRSQSPRKEAAVHDHGSQRNYHKGRSLSPKSLAQDKQKYSGDEKASLEDLFTQAVDEPEALEGKDEPNHLPKDEIELSERSDAQQNPGQKSFSLESTMSSDFNSSGILSSPVAGKDPDGSSPLRSPHRIKSLDLATRFHSSLSGGKSLSGVDIGRRRYHPDDRSVASGGAIRYAGRRPERPSKLGSQLANL